MEIEPKKFVKFLNKVKMSGTMQIFECLMDFRDDGLHMSVNTPNKLGRIDAFLSSADFVAYKAIGKIGVSDLGVLIKVFDRFVKNIKMSVTGNLLAVKSEQKDVDIELVSEDFVTEKNAQEPNLVFVETFNVEADIINEIFSDAKINKDARIDIGIAEGSVTFSNTGKYRFMRKISIPTCKNELSSSFGQTLLDALSELDGTLAISMSKDYPIRVVEKDDLHNITIFVAPQVDREE